MELEGQYLAHKKPQTVDIPSQMNPAHLPANFFKIDINIILQFTPRSSKMSLIFSFSGEFLRSCYLVHALTSRPSQHFNSIILITIVIADCPILLQAYSNAAFWPLS
jgi:hypothetical protein